jgi:LuxR family transcriptional regulator
MTIEHELRRIDMLLDCRTMASLWQQFTACMREMGFPYMLYRGHRILSAGDERMIVDGIALSEAPPALLDDLEAAKLGMHLPMAGWLVRHFGVESWGWLASHPERISAREASAFALFRRYRLGSGIAVSLADRVPRMRAILLLIGGEGVDQTSVDRLWRMQATQIHLLAKLLHERIANLARDTLEPVLTTRQRQVLELTGLGLPAPAIAEQLQITLSTVEKHLRLARAALGARNTAHAVLLAHGSHQIFVDIGERCDERTERAAHADMRELRPWSYRSFDGSFAAADPAATEAATE